VLRWPPATNGDGQRLIAALEQALAPARAGAAPLRYRYAGAGASANVLLGEEWSVRPSQDLIERLGRWWVVRVSSCSTRHASTA